MLLAYADESGDSGYEGSPTKWFVLALVLVREQDWLHILNRMVDMRRYIRDEWGIGPLTELKATHILGPRKRFRGLPREERLNLYRLVLRFQRKEALFTNFAVCVDKSKVKKRSIDPREFAWKFALERLDNYAGRNDEWVHLYPDAGHGYFIRRMVRRMRRFHRVSSAFGRESLEAEARRIIEDPSDRESSESFFIQLADLNAYAAARHVFPSRKLGGEMWDELGETRLEEVNRLSGGPVGIKVFPQ